MSDDFTLERIWPDPQMREPAGTKERDLIDEISVTSEVFAQMRSHVQKDLDDEQEFLLFSNRDDGVANLIVPVGRRRRDKAEFSYDPQEPGFNPDNLYHVIQKHLSQDYRLIADFHNHPSRSGEAMIRNSRPAEYGVGPSISDVTWLTHFVRRDFGVDMVRVIGGLMGKKEIFKAFQVIKAPSREEKSQIEFLVGGDWTTELEIDEKMADLGND
jgi:hypothetical protein